ncbi:tripartite ATP-independent periplasmic transporter DctQ [Oceaniovalibus guishaninsula JLT2003]|uniref:TRAP transporter small permease protein n=1 Tax=Oceaniovalibus guishaninsula JLT2003 TaxID=1231392 RepID=K2HDX4_9RHOB|nr:tripartite ATP-independent periplasmic transporter DctQ [Oceaniovalibus guishaninsula JLT2003]
MPRYLVVLSRGVAAIALFAMMVLTFVDVIGRYAFNAPVFGVAEMIQFLLAISIFAAMSLASANRGHITVDVLEPALDRVARRPRRLFVRALSILTFALIAAQLGELAYEAWRTDRTTIVLDWPLAGILCACALLALVAFVVELSGYREPDAADGPPEDA